MRSVILNGPCHDATLILNSGVIADYRVNKRDWNPITVRQSLTEFDDYFLFVFISARHTAITSAIKHSPRLKIGFERPNWPR